MSSSIPSLLQAAPPLEAFARIGQFLWRLREQGRCPQIQDWKQRCLEQLLLEPWSRSAPELREQSLRALAAGLMCGAVEGAAHFGWSRPPAPWPQDARLEVTGARLDAAWTVARQDWPQVHLDDLQLQAAYGKHLNRDTDQENVDYLMPASRSEEDFRRALLETFRTGYTLGLIDAAIVFLGGELPERL